MYKVDPQSYREYYELQDDDPVPSVVVSSNPSSIGQELELDEMCFVRTVAQFFLNEITVEEYFNRLIDHLKIDAVLHSFDNKRATEELKQLCDVDLISWVVQSLMLDESFEALDATGAVKLKKLCAIVYSSDDIDSLAAADTPLKSLPPHWLDVLAIIAYARRDVTKLEYIVTHSGPPRQSAFDRLGLALVRHRLEPNVEDFQHSPIRLGNRIIEIKMWTAILSARENDWIHYPMTKDGNGLLLGLQCLIDRFGDEPEIRSSPEMERLCRILSRDCEIYSKNSVANFLSISGGYNWRFPEGIVPCSLPAATMLLSCFPLSTLLKNNGLERPLGGESADLLQPLTQWDMNSSDRLEVMRMVLEQGYDPNDTISKAAYHFPSRFRHDTPLHLAAQRGDDAMVDLLLSFGAQGDIIGGGGGPVALSQEGGNRDGDCNVDGDDGGLVDDMASAGRGDMAPDAGIAASDTPAQRARKFGHLRTAARIDAYFARD